jgi:hypothetical protein
MRPIRVYLDSSDFSLLSDPRRTSTQNVDLLDQLKTWRSKGIVTFHFSGIHLSEVAPLEATYADAAQRRADLIVELCERNALISQDRLFGNELAIATGSKSVAMPAYSAKGDWYPEGAAEISPIGSLELAANIKDAILEGAPNREARRKAVRNALRAGRPRKQLLCSIVSGARQGSLGEILQKYPMREQDARVISRFVVGDATAEEASAAFQESLRDPRWMMLWFVRHHDQLTPFIEWTRSPAKTVVASLQEMARLAAEMRQTDAMAGTNLADVIMSASKWASLQDELLIRIATRLCTELLNLPPSELTAERIDKCCPGLSVGVRSLHSAWWTTTQKNPRPPKLSDFPDALHAMYAPYVDIFRADSFMTQYIAKFATQYGTIVVPKLEQLPNAVRIALAARDDA